MKKIIILLTLTIIILAPIAYKLTSDTINEKVTTLVKVSVGNQYKPDTSRLDDIYTIEYIEKLKKTGNGLKAGKNHKIIDIKIIESNIFSGRHTVNVRLKDSLGECLEHIYVIRKDNQYRINDIEIDI